MDVRTLRTCFPGLDRAAYFATAGRGPLPLDAAKAMADAAKSQCASGVPLADPGIEVRALAAHLLDCSPEAFALAGNTSAGINLVAGSLTWKHGDNVVLCEREHPANVIPWLLQAERYPVRVRRVRPASLSATRDALLAAVDSHTRAVAVSYVEFGTGYRNDVAALGEVVHRHGGLLCVDGIQAVGALRIDLADSPIDVLACGGYKWLCGPLGTGFTYVRPELAAQLTPSTATYKNLSDEGDREVQDVIRTAATYPDRGILLAEDRRRFETPKPSPILYNGLAASLRLIVRAGAEAIEERILGLVARFLDALAERNVPVLYPLDEKHRSGIVCVAIPASTTDPARCEAIENHLRDLRVLAHVRAGGVRIAIHAFNTEQEIDDAAEAVRELRNWLYGDADKHGHHPSHQN
ncbi:MAG: aminotransferase class V-fold PLP-dependent enzyme [Thermotogota bacterium]